MHTLAHMNEVLEANEYMKKTTSGSMLHVKGIDYSGQFNTEN